MRIYEALFTGENAGMIVIAVGYPSMAYMEESEGRGASDEELGKLFAERDKIGATVMSASLIRDVTP